MTRASMAEVMTAQYIRTARPEGPGLRRGRRQACPAQRADRALHRHHAAVPLAADRRRRRRDPSSTTRASAGSWCRRPGNNDIDMVLACWPRLGGARPADPADFRRRLRVSQSAHPRRVGRGMESAELSGSSSGSSLRFWPVWIALALRARRSLAVQAEARPVRPPVRQQRRRRRRLDLLLLAVHGDLRATSSRRWTRWRRSPIMKNALPGAHRSGNGHGLPARRRPAGARRLQPRGVWQRASC